MPLKQDKNPRYVQRRRMFIDSDLRENRETSQRYDMVWRTRQSTWDIESMELTDYNFPLNLAPTFINQQGSLPGNNILNVRMEDYPVPTNTLSFQVRFPERKFDTREAFAYYVRDVLESVMDDQGDPHFNSVNTTWFYDVNAPFRDTGGNGAVVFYAQQLLAPDSIAVYFDFLTGPGDFNSAYEVFGYDKADVGGPVVLPDGTFVTYPVPLRNLQLNKFRYVDISIEEVRSDMVLFARVFLTSKHEYRRVKKNLDNTRLLMKPPQKLGNLRIRLRLQGGYKPNQESIEGYDLTIDLLEIIPNPSIPDYLRQELVY